MKELIEKTYKERLQVCSNCEFFSKNAESKSIRPDDHCTKCGCTTVTKLKSLHSSCPINKWKSLYEKENIGSSDDTDKGVS